MQGKCSSLYITLHSPFTVLTFVEAAPARDPGPAAHQVLVTVRDTHGDNVGLELHRLVKSGNSNKSLFMKELK